MDFDVVLFGEVVLELDDGADVVLKEGDCAVQNGTAMHGTIAPTKSAWLLFMLWARSANGRLRMLNPLGVMSAKGISRQRSGSPHNTANVMATSAAAATTRRLTTTTELANEWAWRSVYCIYCLRTMSVMGTFHQLSFNFTFVRQLRPRDGLRN